MTDTQSKGFGWMVSCAKEALTDVDGGGGGAANRSGQNHASFLTIRLVGGEGKRLTDRRGLTNPLARDIATKEQSLEDEVILAAVWLNVLEVGVDARRSVVQDSFRRHERGDCMTAQMQEQVGDSDAGEHKMACIVVGVQGPVLRGCRQALNQLLISVYIGSPRLTHGSMKIELSRSCLCSEGASRTWQTS